MKCNIFLSILVFLLAAPVVCSAASKAFEFTESEQRKFTNQVDRELKEAREKVGEIFKAYQKSGGIDFAFKSRVEHAQGQFNIKQILAGNLMGTEALKSSDVRERILDLLKSDSISETDLIQLQQLIGKEKAAMRAEEEKVRTESLENS